MHTRRRVAPAPRGKHARKQLPSTKANAQDHKHAETRDRTGDLQIFGLTLSQLSNRGHNRPPGIPKPSPACGRKHASCKPNKPKQDHPKRRASTRSTCGLVAMTSAPHAEGRQFDPGQVYFRRCRACSTAVPQIHLAKIELAEPQPPLTADTGRCRKALPRNRLQAAGWPTGQGFGPRSRRFQVRVLGGSCART